MKGLTVKPVHYSVMKKEILDYLEPERGEGLFIDATCGEGGHGEAMLLRYPELKAVEIDADGSILQVAKERLKPFESRVRFFNTWFNQFFKEYPLGGERPDLILFDLGISSFHYEQSGRGFSFQKDEPLDMRLGEGLETSAADIVNHYPEEELADLFFLYGEERYSRRIAKAIAEARKKAAVDSTARLADIIRQAVPGEYRYGRIHPATRSFQALRIMVNGELVRLESALKSAFEVLVPGGRIGVISFHSLEDRIVKRFFAEKSRACTCPPEMPICKCGGVKSAEILTRKPLYPSEEEVSANSASRSAKFRVLRKLKDE